MKQFYSPVLAALLLHQLTAAATPHGGTQPRKAPRTARAVRTTETPETPEKTVSGVVRTDAGDLLPGATVFIKGSFVGTSTDGQGKFGLDVDLTQGPVVLVFSYVGYDSREIELQLPDNSLSVSLSRSATLVNEVVVSASRVEENILRAPVTVEKLATRDVEKISAPEVLTGLGHYKGVDVNSTAMLFTSVSTRGFNTAKSERLIQLIDYADMQMPSLNFSPGNLVGIPELDLESVEIIHGPASALYGSNALSGVVLFNSKDPYVYEGLSARLRGGERNLLDGQLRFAKKLGTKWAVKLTGSYFSAQDWLARSQDATNLSVNPAGSPLGYDALNRYGDVSYTFAPVPGQPAGRYDAELYGKTAYMPGFAETDLLANDTRTAAYRVQGSVSYLLSNDLKATVEAKRAVGSSIYQNLSRIRGKNLGVNQYRAELKSSRGFLRAYTTEDFSGDSYDLLFLGGNLQQAPVAEGSPFNYAQAYFFGYQQAYNQARSQGAAPEQALAAAQAAASAAQLVPGSARFNTLRGQLIDNPDLTKGARLTFRSHLDDVSGQYSFRLAEGTELTAGAAYRDYRLDNSGRFFRTKADGSGYRNYEYGAYAQLSQQLLQDHLKLAVAARLDEFKNFDAAFSPRASAVLTLGQDRQHNLRASYGSAFRSPSQVEQYSQVDVGAIFLRGNLGNGYRGYSVYNARGQRFGTPGADLASFAFSADRLRLERVNTFEAGYKGLLVKKLYLDANYFFNYYQDFIGGSLFISNLDGSQPTPQQLGAELAKQPPLTPFQDPQSQTRIIYAFYNNNRTLRTQGAAVGLTYYAARALHLTGNYSLNVLDHRGLPEGFQTFFNTPKHKYNLGAEGLLGPTFRYSVNYRWVQGHLQETQFATGRIRDYSTVDAYLAYGLPKAFTTVQAGVSNLLGQRNVQVYGGPGIGRVAYLGLLIEVK